MVRGQRRASFNLIQCVRDVNKVVSDALGGQNTRLLQFSSVRTLGIGGRIRDNQWVEYTAKRAGVGACIS
jgi:hypothetical protein